jgi:hypothetical protein
MSASPSPTCSSCMGAVVTGDEDIGLKGAREIAWGDYGVIDSWSTRRPRARIRSSFVRYLDWSTTRCCSRSASTATARQLDSRIVAGCRRRLSIGGVLRGHYSVRSTSSIQTTKRVHASATCNVEEYRRSLRLGACAFRRRSMGSSSARMLEQAMKRRTQHTACYAGVQPHARRAT